MNTSEPPQGSVPGSVRSPETNEPSGLTSAIAELANQLFQTPDRSASNLSGSDAVVPSHGVVGPEGTSSPSVVPVSFQPSTLSPPSAPFTPSPAVSPPPTPSPGSGAPIAASQPPVLPESLAVVDAASSAPAGDAPYFISIAGMPGTARPWETPSTFQSLGFELPSASLMTAPAKPTGLEPPPGPGVAPVAFATPIDSAPGLSQPHAMPPADAMQPADAMPQPAAGQPSKVSAEREPPPPAIPSSDSFATGLYEFEPEVVDSRGDSDPSVPQKPSAGIFDPYAVKRDFPILRERVRGRPIVWLDNAATTQKPQSVIDRLSYFYEHENSNVHRAAHTLAARATDAYEGAREKTRRFINASSTKDIVFVRGTTEGINLIAQSWGRRNVRAGDEIVISWLEHHANIVPWQMLCSEKGAKLKVAPVDSSGDIILEEYEKLLGSKTRLVSFTQVSNALGTVTPAKEMIDMAHRYGACVVLDGAQAVSHMPVDVQALGCDFYVFSGHKVFAPTGIGVVFGKSAVLEATPPWQGGGNMIADVTFERTTYQGPPSKFEAGTGNIADAVGLGAALDYLTSLGLPNVSRHEHELRIYAEGCLSQIPSLRIIGKAREKAGVISFVLDGIPTEQIGGMLDQEGIAVRSGHHCAQPILRRFGLEATVRASLAPYNTRDDIDALVAAVRRIVSGSPPNAPDQ